MDPVRLGVIGCGVIGRVHLTYAKRLPSVRVVAVADLREDAARSAGADFQVPAVYTNAEALLADPQVEAVILAMPTRGRAALAVLAFRHGKHVLVEKPVAINAAEVREMIRARGKKRLGACCSSRYRHLESSEAIAQFIAGGELGELRTIRCHVLSAAGKPPEKTPPAWRLSKSLNGGGILMNWGCYDLDYLLGITGWTLKPTLVLAQAWPVPPDLQSHVAPGSDAEAHFAALVRCQSGAVLLLQRGEYVIGRSEAAWQIVGTQGTLQLQMSAGAHKSVVFDHLSPGEGVNSKVIWEGEESWDAVHLGPLADFAHAIRSGHPPRTTLEQALVVQKITDAIYRSAATGKAVAIH